MVPSNVPKHPTATNANFFQKLEEWPDVPEFEAVLREEQWRDSFHTLRQVAAKAWFRQVMASRQNGFVNLLWPPIFVGLTKILA